MNTSLSRYVAFSVAVLMFIAASGLVYTFVHAQGGPGDSQDMSLYWNTGTGGSGSGSQLNQNLQGSAEGSGTPNAGGGGGGLPKIDPTQALNNALGQAVGGAGAVAQNYWCNPVIPDRCGCGKQLNSKGQCVGSPNRHMCICTNNTNGFTTTGICTAANVCTGQSSSGAGGPLGQGLQALGMLKQIADLFKGGGGGGGGGGGFNYPSQTGCTSFYNVTQPSSDPCAIYSPSPISDSLLNTGANNISDSLLNALNNPQQNSVSDSLLNALNQKNPTSNTTGSGGAPVASTSAITTPSASSASQLGPDGLSGDVRLGGGATFFANLKDGVSEVAGFFGGSFGGQNNESVASKMCQARPWAGGVISKVIPPGFFDAMCRWAGNQVGQVRPSAPPPPMTSFTQTLPGTTTPVVQNPLEPIVNIWAEPAAVRLGTRTYIFWNARNVVSCEVRGPNFEHNTTSGGASTVPIADATTFTLSCVTPDGKTVTDSYTVNLAL